MVRSISCMLHAWSHASQSTCTYTHIRLIALALPQTLKLDIHENCEGPCEYVTAVLSLWRCGIWHFALYQLPRLTQPVIHLLFHQSRIFAEKRKKKKRWMYSSWMPSPSIYWAWHYINAHVLSFIYQMETRAVLPQYDAGRIVEFTSGGTCLHRATTFNWSPRHSLCK